MGRQGGVVKLKGSVGEITLKSESKSNFQRLPVQTNLHLRSIYLATIRKLFQG